ncbi:hypothetical protein LV89_05011 [Arcicella aurantiaca]|uniref:Uncharacterized protein n=1 Tax=Arcicella aurantiaca TaxID=591202 RepID=A0A316D9L2_9BACT|nr:hypothetical protein [Arcicella aurantiaca]PWK13333.1 hypothetical protein LV89_05011 [Arcicella aurantiaca]
MNLKYNIVGLLYKGELPYRINQYKIVFEDSDKDNLSQLLTVLSGDIILHNYKFINLIQNFYEEENKLSYAETHLGGIWEDHIFPDKSIVEWSNMDTTKHNLGLVTTLIRGSEILPTVLYSFSKKKVYVFEKLYVISNDSLPPSIFEIELIEFVKILDWWKTYILNIELGQFNVSTI